MMGTSGIARYPFLAGLVFLTACNSSGIIPANTNLALKDVRVSQGADVNEGAKFSHRLKEEVRYEFSKAEPGTTDANILLEVREMAYHDGNSKPSPKNKNMMVSFGRLVDAGTGESIGEFPLKVSSSSDGVDANTISGREHIKFDLIQKMAKATLEKVYGSVRAKKIGKQFASHTREQYVVQVINPIKLSAIPQDILNGLPNTVVVDPPTAVATGDALPKIIEAPQLPVE